MTAGQRLLCLHCAYDVTGLMDKPCPECGRLVDGRAECVMRDREACLASAERVWTKAVAGAIGAITVCAGGVLILTRELGAAVMAAVALGVLCVGSVGAGAAASLLTTERLLFSTAWVRTLWWLHVPWLVIPGCTILVALIALAGQLIGGNELAGELFLATCLIGLVCWVAMVFACLGGWAARWRQDVERYALGPRGAVAFATILGVAVLFGAALVGLIGGGVGGLGVAAMFEKSWGFD